MLSLVFMGYLFTTYITFISLPFILKVSQKKPCYMSKILLTKLKQQIVAELNSITNEQSFSDWLNNVKTKIPTRFTNPLILVNNSFLFRESIKTKKNIKYIAFKVNSAKTFDINKCYIVEGMNPNNPFKIIDGNSSNLTTKSLYHSITEEIKEIGELVFSLIGEISDTQPFREDIDSSDIKSITLNPQNINSVDIISHEVIVKETYDRNLILQEIKNHLTSLGKDMPLELEKQIDKALNLIEKKAYCTLTIPPTIDPAKQYFLDQITSIIDGQISDYNVHLPNIATSPQAYNEILRISYNFVSDVNKLIVLLINICDLKPLFLWLNISKFYKIESAFKELPKGFTQTKTNLNEYESIVKNARNKSFHQLFPFNKSLEFNITKLGDVKLRMFSAFGNKSHPNELTFKDKDLADLFMGFTRVIEQSVSDDFWVKNINVMSSISELIKAISDSLKLFKT
jgi:hypothetical protein